MMKNPTKPLLLAVIMASAYFVSQYLDVVVVNREDNDTEEDTIVGSDVTQDDGRFQDTSDIEMAYAHQQPTTGMETDKNREKLIANGVTKEKDLDETGREAAKDRLLDDLKISFDQSKSVPRSGGSPEADYANNKSEDEEKGEIKIEEGDDDEDEDERGKQRPEQLCSIRQRLENVQRVCRKYPELSKLTSFQNHLKVDTKHKVLFCLVRKAGSTSVHNLMHMALNGEYLADPDNCGEECWQKSGIQPLMNFGEQEKQEILKTYHKIMVVRHPFERYISCWVNKFKGPKTSLHHRVPGLRLIERIRGVPINLDYVKEVQYWMTQDQIHALNFSSEVKRELAKEMTLAELTKLVDLYEKEKLRHDAHWRQMYQVCQPCAIDYDYMVRVETMQYDSGHILKMLNLTEEKFPQLNHHRSVTNYKLEKKLPDFSVVPDDVMNTLLGLYAKDLELFGYSWDKNSLTAKCEGFRDGEHNCC